MKRKSLLIILASVLGVTCVSLCVALPLTFSYQEGEDTVPAMGGFFPAFHYDVSLKWKRKREEKKEVEISYRLMCSADSKDEYRNEAVIVSLVRNVFDADLKETSSVVLESKRFCFGDVLSSEETAVFTDSVSSSDFHGCGKGSIEYAVSLVAENEDSFAYEAFELHEGPIGHGESYSCSYDVTMGGVRIRKPDIPKNVQY